MGLGGEAGNQTEPASSTLEADIVNGTSTTKQPGEENPPETSAGEPEPVQEPAGETDSETSPEPEPEKSDEPEPDTVDIPPALLQMAGYADAEAAKADGLGNTEALYAYVRGRGQLLAPDAQTSDVYQRPEQQQPVPQSPAQPAPEPQPEDEEFKAFQLPPEKLEMLDEDLQAVLRDMNEHYHQEVKSLRSSVGQREEDLVRQQQMKEVEAFDDAVQALGDDWQDVFGEGTGAELARNGNRDPVAMTNFNHRSMLFEAVQSVREVNAKRGFKEMDLNQEMQFALMQRYPDKFQQTISGNSKTSTGSSPRRATASRPTQRKNPPASKSDKTVADVDAMLRKRKGYSLDMGEEEEFEGEI
jgi:hypothetical protein